MPDQNNKCSTGTKSTTRARANGANGGIINFTCPPTCGAGDPTIDGGHVWDREWESQDGREYSVACRCGVTHMDWTLMRPAPACDHHLVRSTRAPDCVVCSECGEGTSYLYGKPGTPEALALGCLCPKWQMPGGAYICGPDAPRRKYPTSSACALHTPADELQETEG